MTKQGKVGADDKVAALISGMQVLLPWTQQLDSLVMLSLLLQLHPQLQLLPLLRLMNNEVEQVMLYHCFLVFDCPS